MPSQPITCVGCPLYGVGTGFVLGSGNPRTAKMGILLEAPGYQELVWMADEEELSLRKIAYPEMAPEFLRKGMPVVGKSGALLFGWELAAVQLTRRDLFIDNSLRCLPPKVKDTQYPTGEIKKSAEAHCRQYDRWDQFQPTVNIVNIHPAALAREPTPLPLGIKTFEKAKHFYLGGERPLVMCGGKSVNMWIGHGSTVQTWLGHYEIEGEFHKKKREERRIAGMAAKIGPKVKKVKKLTAKTALVLLLEGAYPMVQAPVAALSGEEISTEFVYKIEKVVSENVFKELCALLAPKARKVVNPML